MKLKTLLPVMIPFSLFAHSGHPAPEAHGDMAHLMLGLAVALPIALIGFFLRLRSRKRAEVRVTGKQD